MSDPMMRTIVNHTGEVSFERYGDRVWIVHGPVGERKPMIISIDAFKSIVKDIAPECYKDEPSG